MISVTVRSSSAGIATDYGLDGPGSNPGGGEIFRTCPDRPWAYFESQNCHTVGQIFYLYWPIIISLV
jgi:hypothetical protein